MSISLRSNADGSGTLLNGSTPVMEITAAGVVSLPNIAAGSSANQPVNFGQILGVGQTWQAAELTNTGATFTDGSSKFRAAGVTYTNTTGKPIAVAVSIESTTASQHFSLVVNGLLVGRTGSSGVINNGGIQQVFAIVPAGSTYSTASTITSLISWLELR